MKSGFCPTDLQFSEVSVRGWEKKTV